MEVFFYSHTCSCPSYRPFLNVSILGILLVPIQFPQVPAEDEIRTRKNFALKNRETDIAKGRCEVARGSSTSQRGSQRYRVGRAECRFGQFVILLCASR